MLAAIIVAAGRSTRVGFDKLFAEINGRPLLYYSLEAFDRAESVSEIVLVCRKAQKISAPNFAKLTATVPGGERRQDSVQAGMNAISDDAEFIAVHDAARPLITPSEIERVYSAAREHGAAGLARPITDTLKTADDNLRIVSSIDRSKVFAMQTPQVFARKLLFDSFARVTKEQLHITDEVSAVQHAGGNVVVVPAQEHNFKVTYPSDLALVRSILEQRQAGTD